MDKVTDDKVKNLLSKYSDKRGRINCSKALGIAKALNIDPEKVGKTASRSGYKIENCELAQFGARKTGQFNQKVYDALKKYTDPNNRIKCSDALNAAKEYGIFKVRSTIKNSDIDVIYCLLGCFREKKRLRLKVKTKLWFENKDVGIVMGKGKAEILELIDKKGSIAAAARELGVSYKKIWSHIRTLENNTNKKYVIATKGRNSGGSIITDEAKEFIRKFKKLEKEIEEFADMKFMEMFYADRTFEKPKRSIKKYEKR